MATDDPPEAQESLLTLAAPPAIWAGHFLLSYTTAAVHCAKLTGVGGELGAARWAMVAYTVVALSVLAWLGWRGYARQRAGDAASLERGAGTALARHRFLGFATLLLACLSALAVAYAALVLAFVRTCR